MADDPMSRLLLIVTGSTLRAEEVDRPLAYYVKHQIEEQLEALGATDDLAVRVIADFRWLNDEPLQALPTLSVGGPGVNALTRHWLETIPIAMAVDEQYYLQLDPDLDELRASIWGMDNTTTQLAASAFIHRMLPRFLEECLSRHHESTDVD